MPAQTLDGNQTSSMDTEAVLAVNALGTPASIASENQLETVRNILFGEQFRELERRQATLDRLIRVSVNALAADTQKRIDHLQQELLSIKDLLAEEARQRREERTSAQKRLEQHERQLEDLTQRGQTGQTQLQERLSREVKKLSANMEEWRVDLLQQLQQTAEQLRHEKADRKAVAAILNGMAQQIFDPEKTQGSSK